MKKILLIFIINFLIYSTDSNAKQKILTVAMVNNSLITDIDIKNEIFLTKVLNPNIEELYLKSASLQNLIDQIIKNQEIEKNNIQVPEKHIKNLYNNFLIKLNKNDLPNVIKKNIYLKIETEESWAQLIRIKFSWSAYVNINEIEKNISSLNKNSEEEYLIKDKMIKIEKNKKMNTNSKNYLNQLKEEALIKIYQ
jgi:hypothetical protein